MFGSPGAADALTPELREHWNETVRRAHDRLRPAYGSRFFALDPATVTADLHPVARWFADPATPAACLGPDVARTLCDWGVKGRRALHTEYCEYAAVHRFDEDGTPAAQARPGHHGAAGVLAHRRRPTHPTWSSRWRPTRSAPR